MPIESPYSVTELSNHLRPFIGDYMFFITITIKPRLYKYQSITQYEMTYNMIHNVIETFSMCFAMSVELTSQGNIHYHAIMRFRDKFNRISFINKVRKMREAGYMKITENAIIYEESLSRSCIYLIKDYDTTSRILHTSNYKPTLICIS